MPFLKAPSGYHHSPASLQSLSNKKANVKHQKNGSRECPLPHCNNPVLSELQILTVFDFEKEDYQNKGKGHAVCSNNRQVVQKNTIYHP